VKVNDFQKAWAKSTNLDLKIQNDGVKVSREGKLLGQGTSVLGAVLDAFIQRRKAAETLQTELCTLAALGKDPEDLVEAFVELFTEEDDGEDVEDEDSDLTVEDE